MENDVATLLRELVEAIEKRGASQEEFQRRLLEELRHLNRILQAGQKRATAGDL